MICFNSFRNTLEGMDVKLAIIGGGPGGLYLAALVGERIPGVEITVYERNAPAATYGFGVVFSEPTLRNLREQDESGFDLLFGDAARWPGIDIRIKGDLWRCDGNGFAAIERRRLLPLLAERAERAGATIRWRTELALDSPELSGADVVVVANGANSLWRTANADRLGSDIETASAKFIWFGATKVFDGMTFLFEENEHGWFAAHSYPFGPSASTFVVETDEDTWRRANLDAFDVDQPPGASDEASARYCEKLFAPHLDGGHLVTNNSRWANFRTVRTGEWVIDDRTVLLGDAAHTAHFSVGSGTKMAMEDALCLADKLARIVRGEVNAPDALALYQAERRSEVRKIQDVARPSLSWWEHFGEYATMPPAQFVTHFLTRSGRVGRERLERSDPAFADRALGELLEDPRRRALDQPLDLPGGATLLSRLVGLVVPEDSCDDGAVTPTMKHLVLLEPAQGRAEEVAQVRARGDIPAVSWVTAPGTTTDVDRVVTGFVRDQTQTLVAVDAALVDPDDRHAYVEAAVAQQRVSERLRLEYQMRTILVRRQATADEAETLILSGRADAVAVPLARITDLQGVAST